jgi:hypothetical protein
MAMEGSKKACAAGAVVSGSAVSIATHDCQCPRTMV